MKHAPIQTPPNFAPHVRGALSHDVPLGAQSWFRCGGQADLVFAPADMQDIQDFVRACPPNFPLIALGGLANTIIRDGGVRGAVIRPAKAMSHVEAINATDLRVGVGALNGTVAAAAMKAGIGGLEFLSGIPGCMGGAVAMNAGAYGAEVKDRLLSIEGITRAGEHVTYAANNLIMSYRYTELPYGLIVTAVVLRGEIDTYDAIRARMNDIKTKRTTTQPIREKTGGSTFANPTASALKDAGLPVGTRAWQIVEMVDGRGLRFGGAQMSEHHCNFMINTGDATATDLENLGDELIIRAYDRLGIKLRWEIKRIGERLEK